MQLGRSNRCATSGSSYDLGVLPKSSIQGLCGVVAVCVLYNKRPQKATGSSPTIIIKTTYVLKGHLAPHVTRNIFVLIRDYNGGLN